MKRPPSIPDPWYGPERDFNYYSEVQPVFDRHCIVCHDYGKPAGQVLNLAGDPGIVFNTSYVDLQRKSAIRWFPDTTNQKLLIKVIQDGPPAVLPPYSWGSHRSRLVDILKNGHKKVKLSSEEMDRIITWIDLNAPYYGRYSAIYSENPFARSPLSAGQLRQLAGILDHTYGKTPSSINFAALERTEGSQFSFFRPEMSRILQKIHGRETADYEAALEIIKAGREQLERLPREDLPGCPADPVYKKDIERNLRYLKLAELEKKARQAVTKGEKYFAFKPSGEIGKPPGKNDK